MIRKVIHIDEDKCNGCGICANACHEGAIGMVDGKAKLLRDDYCDGMGDCLPACPTGAITFEEREAAAYNEAAVQECGRLSRGRSPNAAAEKCRSKQSDRNKQLSRRKQHGGCIAASQLAGSDQAGSDQRTLF